MTLREWLDERDMTVAELVRRSGVSRSLIYKYLNADVKPQYKNYRRLHRIVGDEVEFYRPPRRRAA